MSLNDDVRALMRLLIRADVDALRGVDALANGRRLSSIAADYLDHTDGLDLSGLDADERTVMAHLCDAATAFAALDRQHPDELRDFVDGIHRCQDQLAVRVCRRMYPIGWPCKTDPPEPLRPFAYSPADDHTPRSRPDEDVL